MGKREIERGGKGGGVEEPGKSEGETEKTRSSLIIGNIRERMQFSTHVKARHSCKAKQGYLFMEVVKVTGQSYISEGKR